MFPKYTLFGHALSSYQTSHYVGFAIFSVYLIYALLKYEHLSWLKIILYLFLMHIAHVFGGAILPYIYISLLQKSFTLKQFMKSGNVFHSAFLSAALLSILYAKIFHIKISRLLDYFSIGACAMSGIGRIGCFLFGCCYGKPTHLPWGIQFPKTSTTVHPTQLYHFAAEILLILPALLLIQKHKKFDGATFWSYLLFYSVFRFFIEYLRINPQAWWQYTYAQIFSAGAVLLSGIVLLIRLRTDKMGPRD